MAGHEKPQCKKTGLATLPQCEREAPDPTEYSTPRALGGAARTSPRSVGFDAISTRFLCPIQRQIHFLEEDLRIHLLVVGMTGDPDADTDLDTFVVHSNRRAPNRLPDSLGNDQRTLHPGFRQQHC